jgi:hypothetical protein
MDPRILTWLWPVWGLGVAAIFVPEVRRRMRAGPVLLDLGVPEERAEMGLSGRKPRLILAALMVTWGVIETFSPRFRVQGSVFIAWGSFSVVVACIPRRLQLRQAGVLGRKLFRWEDIRDYYISPKGNLTLKLSDSGWTAAVGNVPVPQLQEVAGLLASKTAASPAFGGH